MGNPLIFAEKPTFPTPPSVEKPLYNGFFNSLSVPSEGIDVKTKGCGGSSHRILLSNNE